VFPYGAYTNERDKTPQLSGSKQASFNLRRERIPKACAGKQVSDPKKQNNVLVLLALSGGGSRAAYLAALSMLEMQKTRLKIGEQESDLLHEVDAISSVSGGSIAAAYYAITADPESECAGRAGRLWDVDNDSEIRSIMTQNYRGKWIGNWFWPQNMLAFWFTHFDRTDIMAQTLADNMFDERPLGGDIALGELNELRPNLILNATSGSSGDINGIRFGQVFTFTTEDFARICSSINDYSVARAVMASATFPGAFNFMTLRDQCRKNSPTGTDDARYLHVFDGGTADNLGLTSIKRVIWEALRNRDAKPYLPYSHVIVIQVDAFTDSGGTDPTKPDPRGLFDFIMDTNVVDASSSLLAANRKSLLEEFTKRRLFQFGTAQRNTRAENCIKVFRGAEQRYCDMSSFYWGNLNSEIGNKLTFVHLAFDKIGKVKGCKNSKGNGSTDDCLRKQLNSIATDFKLKKKKNPNTGLSDAEAISCAVPLLFGKVDPTVCGDITPTPSHDLKKKWDRVRTILQNTAIKDKSSANR
jgi:predicted acylesterase/phospholipase RssA